MHNNYLKRRENRWILRLIKYILPFCLTYANKGSRKLSTSNSNLTKKTLAYCSNNTNLGIVVAKIFYM